jgi:hypothetical protein
LFILRNMKEEFDYFRAISIQMAFQIQD